jgi:uncharacterized protein (TIGR00255 family)
MTGFGAAQTVEDGCRIGVEIRSVNGRYLKCVTRLPDELLGLEPMIERAVGAVLTRGTVTVSIRFVDASAEAAVDINVAALARYLEQLQTVVGEQVDASALLGLPGVLAQSSAGSRREDVGETVEQLVTQAVHQVVEMRKQEGAATAVEIKQCLDAIATRLEAIRERAPQVVEAFESRLRQRMEQLLSEVDAEVRPEDLLREVAVFAERSDIAEEVARLDGHLTQFNQILDREGELVGRTLDFLSQEMLREANTIGSKCLDSEVGRMIVEIKGHVDRVKEQVQNLE